MRECRRVKCPNGNRLKGINGFAGEGVWQNVNLVFVFADDVFYVVLHLLVIFIEKLGMKFDSGTPVGVLKHRRS